MERDQFKREVNSHLNTQGDVNVVTAANQRTDLILIAAVKKVDRVVPGPRCGLREGDVSSDVLCATKSARA